MLSQHGNSTSRRVVKSVRPRITAGIAGAAAVGAGVLTAPCGTPAPTAAPAIQLASFSSVAAPPPLTPLSDFFNNLFGSGFAGPIPNPLAAAIGNSCGLVCDGADGTAASPNGQDGGILSGNGGNGINGGNGGNGGLLFGTGVDEASTPAAT